MNLKFYEETLVRHGLASTLYYGLYRCANRLTDAALWNILALTMERVDRTLLDEACVDEVTAETLRPFVGRGNTLTHEFLDQAEARGDRCFAVFWAGRLASYAWYAHRPTPLLTLGEDVVLRFDPQWAYLHNGYTHPLHRGLRLYPTLIAMAVKTLAAEGRRGLISYVASSNFAALKAARGMGFEQVGRFAAVRIGGQVRGRFTRRCDAYGLSVSCTRAHPSTRRGGRDATDLPARRVVGVEA
jgi:ribosomal protein S18 acetylase RimI-like enzyme